MPVTTICQNKYPPPNTQTHTHTHTHTHKTRDKIKLRNKKDITHKSKKQKTVLRQIIKES